MRRAIEDRFWEKVLAEPNSGCWLWMGAVNRLGYGNLGSGGKFGRMVSVHRLSWELHRGAIPEGLCVLHKCDTPSCVNPGHLFLGTIADNTADMMAKGRGVWFFGDRHPRSKLTSDQVVTIRSALGTYREIGRRFGISRRYVGCIKRREVRRTDG